jgi:anti-sigma factor RsiW
MSDQQPYHDMLDDVALYALGTLPAADAQRVREHMATCAECRAEYEALAPAAALVGVSAETQGNLKDPARCSSRA